MPFSELMLPTVMPEVFYVTNLPAHLASSRLHSLTRIGLRGGSAGKLSGGVSELFFKKKSFKWKV